MRLWIVLVILKKELLETLRDRRTLLRMVLLPIVLYPVFALGLAKLEGSEADAREARASRVAVWGELTAEVHQAFDAAGTIATERWSGAPEALRRDLEAGALAPIQAPPEEEDTPPRRSLRKAPWSEPDNPVIAAAREALSRREVDAVVVPWPGFDEALSDGKEAEATVYFDGVRPDSTLARDRVDHALRTARREARTAREASYALPSGFADTLAILDRNVAPPKRSAGMILGMTMPMLMITMSLLGGFLPAIDLTAGEKERGTMQTLLCAPLRPIEIITGKFLTVFVVSLLAALVNVLSLSLTMRRMIPFDVDIPRSTYALTFVILIPVSFFFSALFLAVAAFARDFRDGQNALTPVYLPIIMASAVTALPGFELNPWTAFVPVINVALLIKALFLGEAAAELIFLVLLASGVWAALALVLAARVFEREDVLLGGKESLRSLFAAGPPGELRAGTALTTFAAILTITFYGSLLLTHAGMLTQILVVEYGFILAPLLLLSVLLRLPLRATLVRGAPSLRSLLAALLLGASSWTIAITLVHLLPPPPELVQRLTDVVLVDGRSLPVALFAAAITPAICEEVFFRGFLFASLRRHSAPAAILVTALLFAVMHGSIYRLLPTFFLGIVFGWVRLVTRSVAPGMLVHALNNGIAVALLYYRPAWVERAAQGPTTPLWMLAAGVAVFAAGLATLPRPKTAA